MGTTAKGAELAGKLLPLIGSTNEIDRICNQICRLATTHHRLCEDECSRPWTADDYERIERLEEKIVDLIGQLPETEDGPFTEYLQRDPRGATVKMRINNLERHPSYDGWALEALIVPK